jgi:hypothetical protein
MKLTRIACCFFPVLVFCCNAFGATASVNCAHPGPGQFPTINLALASLNPAGPNLITVQGTCRENVFIGYYQNLTIQGTGVSAAVIENAADPVDIVVQAFGCRGFVMTNLVIRGGSIGLLINQASEAVIQNLVVKENQSDGVVTQVGSTLGVESSKFLNNGGNGFTVAAASNSTLATVPGEIILFSGNAGNGIDVDASYLQVNFGTVRVERNAGAAIFATGSELLFFGGASVGGTNYFQNNGEGIDLFNNSQGRFFGPHVIRNNGEVGMQVFANSSVELNSQVMPDGTELSTTISGHAGPGINVVRSSSLNMNGSHQIRQNGSPGDSSSAGIRAEHSNVHVNGASVSGNNGPGINALEGTTVNLEPGSTVRNNSGDGILLRVQSNAGVFAPVTVTGNGGNSLLCDLSSVAYGDFTGIKNVNCSQLADAEKKQPGSRLMLH